MYSVYTPPSIEDSLSRWQQICYWAQQNDRCQQYEKDTVVSCEIGWIYFVKRGVVRLHGQQIISDSLPNLSKSSIASFMPKAIAQDTSAAPIDPKTTTSLLALVGTGKPFELGREKHVQIQATAHTRNTEVLRIHASELSLVPGFEIDTLQAFRYQHQRQMLRLNNLTQGRTVDQLLGYLHLLAEEFGVEDKKGLHLPFVLTHSQLAGAIGSTRVTITRMLGELRRDGEINISGDNKISLPRRKHPTWHLHLIE
jgi:Crp-like helix-turn-helix domain